MTMGDNVERRLWNISEKAQFAMFLDVLTPKPGNVHRYRDHPDTRFIHFIASITYLGQPIYLAAKWGYQKHTSPLEPSRLGELIKTAVQASIAPHNKNTLLGTILLLIPLAIAAGTQVSQLRFSTSSLRERLARILQNTTVDDAVEVIRAIQLARPGGATPKSPDWTPKLRAFSFQSPHIIDLIQREKYTLRNLQALASTYDAIAQEYVSEFAYTFETLYPQVKNNLNQYHLLESAVLASYLWALSNRPDSLIQRKVGPQVAEEVMRRAKKHYSKICKLSEARWLDELTPFDDYLRSEGSKLNPGTTADLLTAALFCSLLMDDVKSIF